jgi:tRNA A37 threonylcarbamoyladenosine dehydratase
MGNRLDPSKVYLTTLDKTEGDPLARKVRSECRKKGLDLSKILCVVSGETPLRKLPEPASMMMVPSEAGLLIASAAVSILSNRAVK